MSKILASNLAALFRQRQLKFIKQINIHFLNSNKKFLHTKLTLKIYKNITFTMADNISADFVANINSLEDYLELLASKVEVDERVEGDVLQRNFRKIDEAARNKIWQMLFAEATPPTKEQQDDIGAFLKEIKTNAGFHSPWEYNDWIIRVRDELLRRNMTDFWRNEIVKFELGPCTWRDSDYFERDDCGDIAAFYHHSGCLAPFERTAADGEDTPSSEMNNIEDYRKAMELYTTEQDDEDEDAKQAQYEVLSEATRKMIWQLLFEKTPASVADLESAATILKEYRPDAAFYAPWDYNEWIVKVRDELLKRNMIDFWRDVIVKFELGLIWAKDSDYFDNMEDPAPAQFYAHAGCKAPFS